MVVSLMCLECLGCARETFGQFRTTLIGEGPADAYRRSQSLFAYPLC